MAVMPLEQVKESCLVFVTQQGSVKRVQGAEFDVSKRTIAATKLAPGDRVAAVETAAGQDHLVLQTKNGYLLRFPLEEVPVQKKAAMGVGESVSLPATWWKPSTSWSRNTVCRRKPEAGW